VNSLWSPKLQSSSFMAAGLGAKYSLVSDSQYGWPGDRCKFEIIPPSAKMSQVFTLRPRFIELIVRKILMSHVSSRAVALGGLGEPYALCNVVAGTCPTSRSARLTRYQLSGTERNYLESA
jgi:hypothetical protein